MSEMLQQWCVALQILAPLIAFLPLVGCVGLLLVMVCAERSKGFAQFVKYGTNGVIATYVQTVTFYLLAATCLRCLGADDWAVETFGLPSVTLTDGVRAFRFAAATGIGFVISNFVCWLMNRWSVFTPGKYRWHVELGLFYAASMTAAVTALALGSALIKWAGLMTSAAVGIEIVVSFFVNFFVRKLLIFKA